MSLLTSRTKESSSLNSRRILALDALRQIAAFVVFLHHFFIIFEIEVPILLDTGIFDAKAAVILFFVLSGYVLTLSLRREPVSLSGYVNFGIRRVLRLYPMQIAATLISFISLVWISETGGLIQTFDSPISFLNSPELNLRQWLLQLTLVLPGMDANFANPPVWTLMTEAKVSIIFPILGWSLLYLSFRNSCVVVALLIIGSDWLGQHLAGTIALLGHFALGSLIAKLEQKTFSNFGLHQWIAWLLTSLALYSVISLRAHFDSVWIAYYLGSLGAAGIIISATRWTWLSNRLNTIQRFFRVDISYGLYILHFPIMLFFRKLSGETSSVFAGILLFGACLLFTIITSIALLLLIERPAIAFGKRLTSRTGTRLS